MTNQQKANRYEYANLNIALFKIVETKINEVDKMEYEPYFYRDTFYDGITEYVFIDEDGSVYPLKLYED